MRLYLDTNILVFLLGERKSLDNNVVLENQARRDYLEITRYEDNRSDIKNRGCGALCIAGFQGRG